KWARKGGERLVDDRRRDRGCGQERGERRAHPRDRKHGFLVASLSVENTRRRMLFHIKQTHTPENCPYGKGGSRSLFDRESTTVKIIGYWLAFPAHTNYLVVETDDVGHLHNFLLPGAGRTVAEITPVSDKPMPPPA